MRQRLGPDASSFFLVCADSDLDFSNGMKPDQNVSTSLQLTQFLRGYFGKKHFATYLVLLELIGCVRMLELRTMFGIFHIVYQIFSLHSLIGVLSTPILRFNYWYRLAIFSIFHEILNAWCAPYNACPCDSLPTSSVPIHWFQCNTLAMLYVLFF